MSDPSAPNPNPQVPGFQPGYVAPPPYQPPAGTYGMPNPYVQQAPKKQGKGPIFALLAVVVVLALMVIGLVAFWPKQQDAQPAPVGQQSAQPVQPTKQPVAPTTQAPATQAPQTQAPPPAQPAKQTPVGPLPKGASVVVGDAAIQIGAPKAPVVVQVFVDYMCPYCGKFERANGSDLAALVASGKIRLDLHPMSFLDQASSTQYSTRAANAVVTVAKGAPTYVLAFTYALFENQPAEGGAGLSDVVLKALAEQVGVPAAVANSFTKGENTSWVQQATQADFTAGVKGTPTILINGKQFTGDPFTQGVLKQAINAVG